MVQHVYTHQHLFITWYIAQEVVGVCIQYQVSLKIYIYEDYTGEKIEV